MKIDLSSFRHWLSRRAIKPQLLVIILLAIGLWYFLLYPLIYMQTFIWQYTTLGEWIRPISRQGCPLPVTERLTKKRGKLSIGVVMMYGKMDGKIGKDTWTEDLMLPVIQNRRDYCNYHNYTLINAKDLVDTKRPISWSKLLAMDKHLGSNRYDYLFYVDMDIVIMNFSIPLQHFIEADGSEHDILITHDWNGINFGVWLARNTAWTRWFLQTTWNQTQLVPPYSEDGVKYPFDYEQRAVHYLLNTPVWQQTGLPPYPGNSTAIRQHFQVYPQCAFNSYTIHPFDFRGDRQTAQYKEGDFLVHFAGKRGAKKLKLMEHYLEHVHKG